jgi:hypothetical protein
MLQEQLCQRAKTMVEDKEWHKAGEDDPEELTILGKVMGVTREVSYNHPNRVIADVRRPNTDRSSIDYIVKGDYNVYLTYHPISHLRSNSQKLKNSVMPLRFNIHVKREQRPNQTVIPNLRTTRHHADLDTIVQESGQSRSKMMKLNSTIIPMHSIRTMMPMQHSARGAIMTISKKYSLNSWAH